MTHKKVVLITGASRGIGAATALLCAKHGWAVAVNYVANSLAADEVVRQIRAAGGTAMAVQADVAIEAQVLRLFETVDAKLGRISGLVNNAGVVDMPSRVDAMSVERLTRMWTTNITSSFVCAREAVKRMSTKYGGTGGSIVNLSSAAARCGQQGCD
jgi:NAD(P)-dependent dehydrogenase (short-subunit alcohol dehydrogenase family)